MMSLGTLGPNARSRSSSRRAVRNRRFHCEILEDRRLLAITVTTLNDSGPGSLREAILQANHAAGIETITFAISGTIALTSGELTPMKSMHIDGSGQTITIDAGQSSRVLNIDSPDPTNLSVTLSHLTISNGFVSHTASGSIAGGGIRTAGRLTLEDVQFRSNGAGMGGALAVIGTGRATGTHVTFDDNVAYYGGGGVYGAAQSIIELANATITGNTAGFLNASTYSSFGGGIFARGDLKLTQAQVVNNAVSHIDPTRGAFGGGISLAGDGDGSLNGFDARLTDVTFTGNGAVTGGGLHVASGDLDGSQVTITGNLAGQGGGLSATGSVTLRNSWVSGNSTVEFPNVIPAGGGALVTSGGILSLTDAILNDNHTSGRGGAAYLSSFNSAASTILDIRQSTVSGNSAQSIGGAIQAGVGSLVSVRNSQIENNIAGQRGGGIYASSFGSVRSASVIIHGSTLAENEAQTELGGAAMLGMNVQATISHSHIRDNRAKQRGGGLYASNFQQGAASGLFTNVTIQGSQVTNNSLTGTSGLLLGGGIASGANVNLALTTSTLSGNRTTNAVGGNGRGGAVYASAFGFSQTVTMDHVHVVGNLAHGSFGGGVVLSQNTIATIRHSTIDGNSSAGDGGGMQIAFGGRATVAQSTFSYNQAIRNGGGIAIQDGTLNLENATISTNSVRNDGGGIWASLNAVAHSLNVRFSTITGNISDSDADLAGFGGGGMFVAPGTQFALENSIVSGNLDGSFVRPADLYDPGYLGQIRFSLIEDPAGHSATMGVLGNIVGVSAQLGPLEMSAGASKTHQPMSASLVIDRADPVAVMAVDQRGHGRPAGGRHDMGAVEWQPVTFQPGDFNFDATYSCVDVNALTTAIAYGTPVIHFDITGDGQLDLSDLSMWLAEAGGYNLGAGQTYLFGDANLDGVVDGSDFGRWNANKFTFNSNWCDGDFNASGVIDGSDFGLWNSRKFQSSDLNRAGEFMSLMRTTQPATWAEPFTGTDLTAASPSDRIEAWTGVIDLVMRERGENGSPILSASLVNAVATKLNAEDKMVNGVTRRVADVYVLDPQYSCAIVKLATSDSAGPFAGSTLQSLRRSVSENVLKHRSSAWEEVFTHWDR